MKSLLIFLLVAFLSADKDNDLLNKPVPVFSGQTLEGKNIDNSFFTGKVTLLNFMALGCEPCMKELPFLHELDSTLHHQAFQILCVAPHSRERLLSFNSDKKSQYSSFRKAIGVELIKLNLMPECEITKKSPTDSKYHLTLLHDCELISSKFNVEAYPMTFLIDKTGIIRNIETGYPLDANDSIFKKKVLDEIESLLK